MRRLSCGEVPATLVVASMTRNPVWRWNRWQAKPFRQALRCHLLLLIQLQQSVVQA